MPKITSIKERIIFNSRGDNSIEIDVISDNHFLGRSCAPSGASVGIHEAQSFVENNPQKTLINFRKIKNKFIGLESSDLKSIHEIIKSSDDSPNYSTIGGSVAYALTISSIDSASNAMKEPFYKILSPSVNNFRFPYPIGNALGGGAHAGPGTPDLQEYLICPVIAKSVYESIKINSQIHKELKKQIEKIDPKFTYGKGDEGGWAPNIDNEKAIELVEKAIVSSGYDPKREIRLGIDFASSSLWNSTTGLYEYKRHGKSLNTDEQIDYTRRLIENYNLIYVEDPVHEEDFESMSEITKKNPNCLVTGDDLLVTNKGRVETAKKYKSCSGAILKVNQAGSLYDAMLFAEACKFDNIKLITSHRSGESVDNHISHIAIATNSIMIKTGIIGGERISKLNELIRISEYDLIEGMAQLSNI